MTRTIEMQKNMMTLIICIKYVVVVILAKIFKRASVAGQGWLLKHGRLWAGQAALQNGSYVIVESE